MRNMKSDISWEKENNELQKQIVGVKKVNRELEALIDSQRRLIAKYKREVEDLNLLLSVKVEKINEK